VTHNSDNRNGPEEKAREVKTEKDFAEEAKRIAGKRSPRKTALLYWKRLLKNPSALIGTLIFLFFLLMAFVGPWVAPYQYDKQNVQNRLERPSLEHPCGTDMYGRDVLSRIIVGSRDIFIHAGIGTLLASLLGIAIGLFSGYYGGLIDEGVMRFLDVLLSFPPLLLALVLLSTVGSSTLNLILVVTVLYLPMMARVMRSMVLDLKTKEFIEASKVRGESDLYILFREILPNSIAPLLVETSMRFAYSIFLVASLGFLGLGVQPPSPDWGLQINVGRSYFFSAPWILLFPAATISLLVIAINLMTDGLRHVLQPGVGR
jgi:peptide/nickel transport system permease protein